MTTRRCYDAPMYVGRYSLNVTVQGDGDGVPLGVVLTINTFSVLLKLIISEDVNI